MTKDDGESSEKREPTKDILKGSLEVAGFTR